MSYTLYGFVAKSSTFDKYVALDDHVSVANLNSDFDLLLNDDYLRRALGYATSDSPEGFEHWLLSEKLIEHFRELSYQTPIAYIISDYLGGMGQQKTVVWIAGEIAFKEQTEISPVSISIGPVNSALKLLGVTAEPDKDEFETLRLGRNRHMAYWFQECTGISYRDYY